MRTPRRSGSLLLRLSGPALAAWGGLTCLSSACTPLPRGIELLQQETLPDQEWHQGPKVEVAPTGTARFVRAFVEGIDEEAIAEFLELADPLVAAPASPAFDQLLDELADELRGLGFGANDARLSLEFIERIPRTPAWTPQSASVRLVGSNGRAAKLHAFTSEEDVERALLPLHARECDLTAPIARRLADLDPGEILVTEVRTRQVLRRAHRLGAAAVVSASLGAYNSDPSGRNRHVDAIQVVDLGTRQVLPTFQISQASLAKIDALLAKDAGARLELAASIQTENRPLRTLVAKIEGASHPDQAVVVSAHVQGPGAVNNKSGVAGVLEGIRVLRREMREGDVDWPRRSLVFLFGDELRQAEAWLDETKCRPVAAIVADMIGSRSDSGAIALLEREPDPGAWRMLLPDEPSSWGGASLERGSWTPTGLSLIARSGLIDTGLVEGSWRSADHPFEGGSDHDVFLERGVPAVLFWHFVDFTFSTSLDRRDMVDVAETRRTAAAIFASALAVASPEPKDLERYLRSLDHEIGVRTKAATEEEDPELQQEWNLWSRGARQWLRNLCLDIDEPLPADPDSPSDL